MEFSEKLVTLMDITKTSNKALANYLYVDPSMISQIRTGRRGITKKRNHLNRISEYFATHCVTRFQYEEILEYVKPDDSRTDYSTEEFAALIYRWLNSSAASNSLPQPDSMGSHELPAPDTLIPNCSIYAKKKTLDAFYEYLLALNEPGDIYFISDETPEQNLTTLQTGKKFRQTVKQLLAKGYRFIYILHADSVYEELASEMLHNISYYFSGQLTCCYYPSFSDDIFRRSMILVPQKAAYISSSRKNGNNYYVNFTTDQTTCSIVAQKISDYFSLCKRSFTIYPTSSAILQQFFETLHYPVSGIVQSPCLSPLSMPLPEMIAYMKNSENEQLTQTAAHYASYDMSIPEEPQATLIELCHLATLEEVCQKKVVCPFPMIDEQTTFFYTPKLYLIHLQAICNRLLTDSSYTFYDVPEDALLPCVVLEKTGSGILVFSSLTPNNCMHIQQLEITRAIREYLYHQCEKLPDPICDRTHTISRLKQLIKEFTIYCQNND